MKERILDAILGARAARRATVRLLWLESGEERLLASESELPAEEEALVAAVHDAFVEDEGGLVETSRGPVSSSPSIPRRASRSSARSISPRASPSSRATSAMP